MRVLIAEDDKDIVSFLKTRLEEKCFAVDASEEGGEALYRAKTNEYDMILLDYALPGKNGFDICSELRTSNIHTPIIMISATKEIPHKVEGFYYGIDDYVTKPFYFEELFARIQAILRRPPLQENSILRVDDLALDPAAQKVMRGKESIYLTRKEFSLLEYLMKSSGRVVTRGAIIEHIWDMNLDPFSNTLETHILNLRKKIDLPRKKKLIHCVPGRGYKIDIEK